MLQLKLLWTWLPGVLLHVVCFSPFLKDHGGEAGEEERREVEREQWEEGGSGGHLDDRGGS